MVSAGRDLPWQRGSGPPDGNRGQLILVGAVVIAVALVGVVVVLNTVLYTENVVHDGARSGASDSLDVSLVVRNDLGPLVDGTNYNETYANASELAAALDESVDRYATLLGVAEAARQPATITVDVRNATVGYAVVHDNDSATFRSGGGKSNWTVARDADARQYELTVDPANGTTASDGFRLSFTDGTDRWNLSTYRQDGDVSVRTTGTTVAPSTCPSVTTGNLTIELRNGTAGSCTFDFAPGLDRPYDVSYVNGGNATGVYSVVLNGTSATLPSVNTTTAESPYRTVVAYEVEATMSHVTPDSTYRTRINATLYEP